MRLKDRNLAPIGGFWYYDEELDKKFAAETLKKLRDKDALFRRSNSIPIPDNLEAMIEDQICMRQPAGRCWYEKKLGDQISRAVHAGASVIDSVLGTQLHEKAKGCRGCGRRRNQLNK